MKLSSYMGHRFRELMFRIYARRNEARKVLFFVGGGSGGSATGLRGYQIAEALSHTGWSAEVVPPQLELVQRRRVIRWFKPNVIVLQKTRHHLNRPHLYSGVPLVFDIDDADYLNPKCIDAINLCAFDADAVVAGSEAVAQHLRGFSNYVKVIWTGAKPVTLPLRCNHIGPPVLVWACSDPAGYQPEAFFLREVLIRLTNFCREFKYVVIGKGSESWFESYFQVLREGGVICERYGFMPYHDLIMKLSKYDIGLAPLCPKENPYSNGKSFGKILAYLNARVAVVASDAADHAKAFANGGGLVVDTTDLWIEALQHLINDFEYRRTIAHEGRKMFEKQMSIDVAARRMSDVLDRAIINWEGRNH